MAPGFTDDSEPDGSDARQSSDHRPFLPSQFSPRCDPADRARAEAALCAHFREQKFQGPDWRYFVHELLAYGIQRVRMLIVSGIIAQENTHRHRCWPGLHGKTGELDELVHDVVMAGFKLFVEKGLIGRQWSPSAGASLTTYFIRACKLTFPETHRTWHRRNRHLETEEPTDDIDALLPGWCEPDEHVQHILDLLTEALTEEEVRLFVYVSEGYSHAEIARELNTSERAIEGRIYRARAKARPFLPRGWGESQ